MAKLKKLLDGLWHVANGNQSFLFSFNENEDFKGVISVISNGFIELTDKPKNFVFCIETVGKEIIMQTIAFDRISGSLKLELLDNCLRLDDDFYLYR